MARRLAQIAITAEFLLDSADVIYNPSLRCRVVESEVPIDAKVVSVNFETITNCFIITLEHETFAQVNEGCRIPRISLVTEIIETNQSE